MNVGELTGASPDARIAAAMRLAAELLEPAAAEVDRTAVPRAHLDVLAANGLLGLHAPVEAGGSAAPRSVIRAVDEILAAADPATWFVQAQHHTPVALLASGEGPARERLPPLARGEVIAGMAFAHVRRFPTRPVTARRARGGWRFDGATPWYTGWGINDVALLAGVDDDAHVVLAFAEARASARLHASAPLAMAALAAAQTVRLELRALLVPDEDVVMRLPYARWNVLNRTRMVDASPAVFGLTAAAVRLLGATGERDAEAARLAHALTVRLQQARERCYTLADADPEGRRIEARLGARADAYALLTAATTAAVVAGGGHALGPGAPAQRLARAGLFLLVLTQTDAVRAATLRRWQAAL